MTEYTLKGAVIAQFESRRASELENLIRRHGGNPWSAPALSEEPIGAGPSERAAIDRLASGDFDIVVLLTGVATRRLLDEATIVGHLDEARRALERATIVARGPKPVFALRQHELKPTHIAPEPNTTKELLDTLAEIPVTGKRVLILSAGEPFVEPAASLQARGAHPVEVQLYRWALTPNDRERVGETIRELIGGRIDAALFTTQVQVRHLFEVAAQIGETERLVDALRNAVVVGAVGPTCAAALRERGIEPDVLPNHPKMGHLVVALVKYLTDRELQIGNAHSHEVVETFGGTLTAIGELR